MELYKLSFRALSSLSRIPDAQTLFGAFCHIILYTKGEDELHRYIDSFGTKPLFVHSAMFLEDFLPMPQGCLFRDRKDDKNDIRTMRADKQLEKIKESKEIKKITRVSYDIFQEYIKDVGPKSNIELLGKMKKSSRDNNSKIDTVNGALVYRNSGKAPSEEVRKVIAHNSQEKQEEDQKLYHDENVYYPSCTHFSVYVKTDDIDYVKSVVKYSPYFGFGSRVSVGKNCFELENVKHMEKVSYSRNFRLLLSKCLGDDFNLENSGYTIVSTVYRGSRAYSHNAIGRFNEFGEGSFMEVRQDKEYYGHIQECYNGKKIYHYGIGFVL